MNTYSVTSGIGTEFCNVSREGLIALIKKADKYKIANFENVNLDEVTLDKINEIENIRTIIGECLNEITGLNSFCGISDDDGGDYVVFVDKAPWDYTDKELELTKDNIVDYFHNILGDVILDMEICDLEIANYLDKY